MNIINLEQALDILKGWRDSRSRISVSTVEDGKTKTLLGQIVEASGDSFVFMIENGKNAVVDLRDAKEFRYADMREASDPEIASRIFVCALEIEWSNNSMARFLEVKEGFNVTDDLSN